MEALLFFLLLGLAVALIVRRMWGKVSREIEQEDRRGRSDGFYTVGIVGESNYQAAINRCRVGEKVQLLHEPDNPHSSSGKAIAVQDRRGRTIGYIPEKSWLKRALLRERKGVTATISRIAGGGDYPKGVWLRVKLEGDPIGERAFQGYRDP